MIAAATRMGPVRLAVADLELQRSFYERAIGLTSVHGGDGVLALGPPGGEPLVELRERPGAPPAPARSTGLFHVALLFPGRPELALAVRRVADAGVRFTGAADHYVSEALYLNDPEGNGIELYRDRPRTEWPRRGDTIVMGTVPLELEALMEELPPGGDGHGAPPETTVGHVHLRVADLRSAEAFHSGLIGFDVTTRDYPGALFVSAGGYHHHLGMNSWASAGAPAPPPGARGLERYEVLVPDRSELERVAEALRAGGAQAESAAAGVEARDPSGNRLLVRVAPRA